MAAFDYDLIVIGSGPAGQRAALQGAKSGKKVAVVEEYPSVGGGCLQTGTIPSKSLRESVYRYSLSSRGTLGLEGEKGKKELPDMKRLMKRKERVIDGESQIILDQLKRNGIDVILGRARISAQNQVDIGEGKSRKRFRAKFVFLAVGSNPVSPAFIDVDGKTVHDSNTILGLKKFPRSVVVLGAGIIGCEYASMFATGGAKVILVDKRHEILASVDREIVAHLTDRFQVQGMEVVLDTEATKVEMDRRAELVIVHLKNGTKLKAEIVLVAQGRKGNTEGLGLESVGVEADARGLLKVDKSFRTSQPWLYAVGDVVGAPALASTSMEQGRIACSHAFQLDEAGDGYEMPAIFPYGIYTIPEISTVGLNEEEARAKGEDFVCGRARYRELARGQIIGDQWGLLKMVIDRKTLKILGVHIVGDNAADLIHIGQAVMDFGGDVSYFIRSVFNYPTLAEAYKTAAFHAVNQIKGRTKTK